jgi:hypothetical protein
MSSTELRQRSIESDLGRFIQPHAGVDEERLRSIE